MKFPIPLLAILVLICGAGTSFGQTVNWHNATFDNLADSNGVPLDDQFTFQLGIFGGTFTPDEENVDDWLSNWHVFDEADFDKNFGYFTGVSVMKPDGSADIFENETAYIWIRKGDEAEHPSEWLLVSDPGWIFPEAEENCCPNGIPLDWAISDLEANNTP